jgi:outer membrane protein
VITASTATIQKLPGMKHLLACIAVATLVSVPAAAQSVRFGHVDRDSLVDMLPQRDSAEATVKTRAVELDRRLKAMQAEWELRVDDYQKNLATMPASTREAEEAELTAMRDRMLEAQSRAEKELESLHDELMGPVYQRVDDAIKAVATEKGIVYVFDLGTGAILYSDKGGDITAAVKAKLGLK